MDYTEACGWLHLDPERVIDEDKLKRAFRKSAIREHPDKSKHDDATKRFQSVKRAHTFLEQCVERGETGPDADLERTDDHDEDDDDDHVDIFEHFMAHVYVSHLQHQMRAHMGGVPFGMRFRAGRYPDDDDDYEDDEEDDDECYYDYDEDSYDDDDEDYRYGNNSRRRQEEQAQKEQRKRMEMERKRQQAMEEGREFFESWSVKQLQQEAGRRGFNTKGLQQESLVELLIEDEAKKRKKIELKRKAPLVDEWVEIIGVTSQPHLNGMKARAIDFSEDRYTVEWEDPSLKKKSPQYRHMYGEKKKARFKPENIKLWGSVTPPVAEPEQKQEEAPEEQVPNGKKSRRARRKAAKKRQQEQQEKQQHQQEEQKDQKLEAEEKSNDSKKRNIGGFSCTHKVTNLMGQKSQQKTGQNNNGSSKRERDDDDGDDDEDDLASDPRLDSNSDDYDDEDEFDDLPDLVTKPAPGSAKKPQQEQEQKHNKETHQPTKPIFGSNIFGKDSKSNGSKEAPIFSFGSGTSSPPKTYKKRATNNNSNKGETGPTTPWTTPMFGSTTNATSSTFTFGGEGQKESATSPSFGSSSTFKFGGSDSSNKNGEKTTFTFGSTDQEEERNQKKQNIRGEKKADDSSLKTSEKKEEEPIPKKTGPTLVANKFPESNKKPPNQSPQGAALTNQPKATPKPNNKSTANKTMDQFERLAKELGDKVDLTDDITGLQSLYNDGYIQHKVKCPKNKKPGDFIEFTNPHIKGQKQRVQIPAGVKPEKFFKVFVPLPKAEVEPTLHCACCMKVVKKEKSAEEKKEADEDKDAVDIGVPLRACAHYCCTICHEELGKTCPSCKTPLPTSESLDPLPFIEDLDNPSDVVKKALLEEYYSKKEADRLDTKEAKDSLDEASEAATKAVDKHYRRASLKVHPDRFGEKFRKEFNALTKARDVFRNNDLRRKYLIEMLDIVCRVDIGYIGQSHQVWIEKNDPDMQEKTSKSASSSNKPGPEAPLQLDGGVAFSRPKRPRIFIQSEKAKRLKLYLPLVNEYQFLEYCKKVFVYGNCGHIDEQNIILADIKRSKLDIVDGQIRCEVELLDNGIWDISWSAWLEMDGKQGATPTSTGAKVDLRDASQRNLEQRKLAMERLALRSTNDIKSRLRSSKGFGAGDRQKIEESNNLLHPVIARGRDISTKFAELLRGTGETSSASLAALLDCLQEAVDYKGQLEKSLKAYGKRDARRAFKEMVANKLERGNAEKWVASVSEDDLKILSGDSNRLYQLLIEGKKANSLTFNDTTIESAENRTDLFTTKQIEALKRRRMEVQALHVAELEAAMEEAEKQKTEEARRKQMEKKAEEVSLRFGDAVKIHDLVSRKDLNGATGTYLGFAQGDRYTVRLDRDGKEIALKACNFSGWDGKYVPPWSCAKCTFRHEGMLAAVSTCNICGAERTAQNTADDGSKAKTDKTTKQDANKDAQTKNMPNGSKVTTPAEPRSTAATKGGKPKGSNFGTGVSATRNSRAVEFNKVPTRASQKQQSRPSAKASVPTSSQPKAEVNPQQENSKHTKVDLTSSNSFEPKIESVQPTASLSTTVPLEGPRLPSNSDTKEEIAYSDHPGVIAALSVLDFEPEEVFEKAQGPQENLDTSNFQASPVPPEVERAKPIRCKYGVSCKNLKRGVEKCKFYHPPDEVVESQKRKTQKKVCRHGLDCEKLKRGPTECPFYHSGEQINVFHPKYEGRVAGANSTLKGQATSAAGSITASGLGSSFSKDEENTNVRRNLKIPATHAPLVIGKNGKRIQGIIKKSGAQVAITHKTDSNGMCSVHITGNSGAAVQMAADLVIEAAAPKVSKNASAAQVAADNSDDLSGLTGDSSSFPTGNSKPSIVTPSAGSPSAGSGGDSLLSFLQSQKACFKCPPARFHQFLVREDIVTVTDLAEACEDEDYHCELQDNGLKGFKRGPFLKAVAKAAAETSCN